MSDHVLQLLYDQFDGLLARLRDLGVDTSERAALWAFVCIACQGMPGQDEHMLQRALEALTSVPTLVGMGFPERGAIAAVVRRGNLQDALTSLTAGEQSFDAGVAEYDEVTDFAADLRRPITAVLHRATEAEAIKIAARLRINNVTGEFLAIASYFAQASRLGQFFQEYVQATMNQRSYRSDILFTLLDRLRRYDTVKDTHPFERTVCSPMRVLLRAEEAPPSPRVWSGAPADPGAEPAEALPGTSLSVAFGTHYMRNAQDADTIVDNGDTFSLRGPTPLAPLLVESVYFVSPEVHEQAGAAPTPDEGVLPPPPSAAHDSVSRPAAARGSHLAPVPERTRGVGAARAGVAAAAAAAATAPPAEVQATTAPPAEVQAATAPPAEVQAATAPPAEAQAATEARTSTEAPALPTAAQPAVSSPVRAAAATPALPSPSDDSSSRDGTYEGESELEYGDDDDDIGAGGARASEDSDSEARVRRGLGPLIDTERAAALRDALPHPLIFEQRMGWDSDRRSWKRMRTMQADGAMAAPHSTPPELASLQLMPRKSWWAVAVPNGVYRCAVTLGDVSLEHTASVSCNEHLLSDQVFAKGVVCNWIVHTQVTNGRIVLRNAAGTDVPDSLPYWPRLLRIHIAPLAFLDTPEAEAALAEPPALLNGISGRRELLRASAHSDKAPPLRFRARVSKSEREARLRAERYTERARLRHVAAHLRTAAEESATHDALVTAMATWQCPACTMINEGTAATCSACERARPGAAGAAAPPAPPMSVDSDQSDEDAELAAAIAASIAPQAGAEAAEFVTDVQCHTKSRAPRAGVRQMPAVVGAVYATVTPGSARPFLLRGMSYYSGGMPGMTGAPRTPSGPQQVRCGIASLPEELRSTELAVQLLVPPVEDACVPYDPEYMHFRVTRPSRVWVALDFRVVEDGVEPAWLCNDYELLPEELMASTWATFDFFRVYRGRNVLGADEVVTLGTCSSLRGLPQHPTFLVLVQEVVMAD